MAISSATMAAFRFGYGFAPGERGMASAEALLAGALDRRAAATLQPVKSLAERLDFYRDNRALRRQKDRTPELKAQIDADREAMALDYLGFVFQRAFGHSSFFERLSAFWCDHFTVAGVNRYFRVLVPSFEVDAIRPHVAGSFQDMLIATVRHPLMLHYLNQTGSIGPNSPAGRKTGGGLNENLAREILELHTLGVNGPYTQHDVRQFAELLTGFSAGRMSGQFAWRPNYAEPGAETVLGKAYGGGEPRPEQVEALLVDLARHPTTAQHIAWKLAVHFVADAPPDDLVAHVASAWRDSGGHLPTVYRALLEHPASWRGFGAKVRWPIDYVAAMLRSLGTHPSVAARLRERPGLVLRGLANMGQPLFQASGPDGWEEASETWLTPQTLSARLTAATAFGTIASQALTEDPRSFARDRLRDALHADTLAAVALAADRAEAFALVFASPEFNRR